MSFFLSYTLVNLLRISPIRKYVDKLIVEGQSARTHNKLGYVTFSMRAAPTEAAEALSIPVVDTCNYQLIGRSYQLITITAPVQRPCHRHRGAS